MFQRIVVVLPVVAAAGVSSVSFYKLYQHTFDAENTCTKMSYYGDLKTPLDNNTQIAVDKAIDKLLFKATAKRLAMTQFYWSNKPFIHHTGSTQSRFGTFIGIPVHYKYQKLSEVDLSDLQSSSTSEPSELLERLRASLVLSENAKKFAISSEFFSADSFHLYMKADNVAMVVGAYYTMEFLSSLYPKAVPIGMIFITLVGVACFWTVISYVVNGLYYRRLAASSDRKAALLSEDFLEGGLEYLTKVAEKNKALRELNPETAMFIFKPNGDEMQSFFDIRRMTTSERLEQLQNLKKKRQLRDSHTGTEEVVDS